MKLGVVSQGVDWTCVEDMEGSVESNTVQTSKYIHVLVVNLHDQLRSN